MKNISLDFWKASTVALLAILVLTNVFDLKFSPRIDSLGEEKIIEERVDISQEQIAPADGAELNIIWGNLGMKMVETGVIDKQKIEQLYAARGGFNVQERKLLFEIDNGKMFIDPGNAGFILNVLWAFGLANDNSILTNGDMQKYGDAGRFASTGGWSLSSGDAMDHYSKHSFVVLTEAQQELVREVSQNIYRPCCGNSTHFPDCNHGMAMLGFLELLASQGASEKQMYSQALILNSYWFPDNYVNIAKYFASQGIDWQDADPKEALGVNYSSSSGYRDLLSKIKPAAGKGGGSCGV